MKLDDDPPLHHGPGRRFATGSTREDQLLGAFGFVAHAFTFTFVGSGLALLGEEVAWVTFGACGSAAVALLIIRALQVGATTTKESFHAIRDAWFPEGPP